MAPNFDDWPTRWFEISPESADPSGWILVELPWDRFARAEWADEGGLAELDPSRVVGIGLSFANPDDSQLESIVWVDDVRLLSEAPPPAPTEVEPEDTPATATEAPVAATPTEATVVTEPTPPPAPVAPAEEGSESTGFCPVSLGLVLAGLVLVGRGPRKPK